MVTRYKKLFSEETYKLFEADEETTDADTSENAGDLNFEPEKETETSSDSESAGSEPTDTGTADTTAPEETTGEIAPTETVQDSEEEAAREAEKEEELNLQGKVSNILSEIADQINTETLTYYSKVEEYAIKYFNEKLTNMSPEAKKELLKDIPEIALKIVSTALKNNFVDKDHIAYTAVAEGYLEIMKGIEYPDLDKNLDLSKDEE